MTLTEAIEILTNERKDHHSFSTDIIGQAEQLLIEAGKRLSWIRTRGYQNLCDLLPGETEE